MQGFLNLLDMKGNRTGRAWRSAPFHWPGRQCVAEGLSPLRFAEKIAALVQSHRMGKHLPDVLQPRPRGGDQVVLDAKPQLSANKNVAFHPANQDARLQVRPMCSPRGSRRSR